MTKKFSFCSLFLFCVLALSHQAIASGKSFLDEVYKSDKKFDARSVPLDKQVLEEAALAKGEYHGGEQITVKIC